MCGRFIQSSPAEAYERALGQRAAPPEEVPGARYNIGPTLPVLAMRAEAGGLAWKLLRWGLIPHWSKGPDRRFSMINARAESVAERAAYREPFRHQRCIIPADGFYEWRAECSGRQPYLVRRRGGAPLFFAGLWDRWRGPDGVVESCAIIVTDANAVVAPIHDRMPVILDEEAVRIWLDAAAEPALLKELLRPAPEDWFEVMAVSRRVNSVRNEGPELIEPLAPG